MCFEVLLAMITLGSTIYIGNIYENITQTTSAPSVSSLEGAKYICDNFSAFKGYYNEIYDDKLTATSIENLIPLSIENEGNSFDGILLDLNDSNGYITIGYDYEIYDVEVSGNQPFGDHKKDKPVFSTTCGYFYYDDKCSNWISVINGNNSLEVDWENIELNQKTYAGQEENKTGCGEINDPYLYVNDKYGSGFKLDESNSLKMKGYKQTNLSAYWSYKKDGEDQYSEGNCWMVSAYNVLNFLAQEYYTDMYKPDETKYDAQNEEPNIYKKHFDEDRKCKETIKTNDGKIIDKWKLTNHEFPKLYAEERELVDSLYGKCDGGATWQTNNIIHQMTQKYGYKTYENSTYLWEFYANQVPSKIDKNLPCLWSTATGTYGSHSMAVCGYKYYKKITSFWFFKSYKYKLFYELKDGYSEVSRYYDVSGNFGFACITFIDIKVS